MTPEQKITRTRKRSQRFGSAKHELSVDKLRSGKKESKPENAVYLWLRKEWLIIVGLILIFIISLFLRSYFYYPVATENGYLLSGNDPFYHKRVIDYSQEYFTHLKWDPLLDYPLIGVNPRPPVYDWTNAIAGLFLSPITGDMESTTWMIFIFSPALWGALTIFPVYYLTRDIFGRKPAIISAFFMGIMASHIERSPLGFSDHDAMVVFFVVAMILFLVKAVGNLKYKYWVKDWKNPIEITKGIRDFFVENPVSVAFSIMSGFSVATIALIWKGFPYVLVIILASFMVLSVINHLRKHDSMGIFICMYLTFAIGLAVSLPWYALFNIGTWIQPLYMMMAFIILGMAFMPSRDLPWIIVLPIFFVIMGGTIAVLQQIQPETVDALFTGGGYFIKSKLYSTIAEAQAPDTSRLAISYGPVTFYLSLIGLVVAAIQIPKHWKMDFFLIIVWCALAIYMALSAVRFMFNATPVFAVLSGWITWKFIEQLDPTLRSFKKVEIRFIYLYIGIITLLIMSLGYWWVYLEHESFEFLQVILGVGLLGIFIALFTAWIMLKYNFMVGIIIYVLYIVFWIWYTFDNLINETFKGKEIIWDKFPWELFAFSMLVILLVFVPVVLFLLYRRSISGARLDMRHIAVALFLVFLVLAPNIMFAIDASIPYEKKAEYDPTGNTFGAFGHSFPSDYWQEGMVWLAEQDNEFVMEERPAFISWWDYGFWCLYLGEHPTVADNFQAGYQLAGSFIASTNETQAVSLFAVRIIEGDFRHVPNGEFSPEIREVIIKYLDKKDPIAHPNYDKIYDIFNVELESSSKQKAMIKEVEKHPEKYGNFDDLKIRNAKYAMARYMIEKMGKDGVVEFLAELESITGDSIRYFAVDTRLFPFSARNTGIFYAPIKLADRDITDFIKYYALVEVRDNREADWRSYSDRPVPTEKLEDEIDLNDIVETHGSSNVRIKDYQIKYTDDFYNSMFYKCYIGYTYDDLFPENPTDEMQSVPGIYGQLANNQPMQGWNMTHFRLVYRTAYWTPHNQTELGELEDEDKDWQAMGELEAIRRITSLESDGKDNDKNGQIDDRGEGGTWSPSYRGGGVFFLKYYHGAIVRGKVVTDSYMQTPIKGARVTVFDEFGIPHHTVITDDEGNYNLTVPFGNIIITISKDGFPADFDTSFEMRAQITEQTNLNTTYMEITDQQAMRKTNYIINENLKVPVSSVTGKLYIEKTGTEGYNKNEDRPIIDADARIFLDDKNSKYNRTYTTTEFGTDGTFELLDVVPGTYSLSGFINGHYVELPDEIVVESGGDSVTQDFPIKQAVVKGNATFTNNTAALPNNVTIKLYDMFNKTTFSKVLKNNRTYKFDELLPGDYLLYVDTPGIKYQKANFTLEEDEEKNADLILIPLVPVKGKVYNDLLGDGFDPEDIVENAHVEFMNLDNTSLSNVLVTDHNGEFYGNITSGNYTIYIHYVQSNDEYVHASSINVLNKTAINLELGLEKGFWINGTVTKQAKTPVMPALVNFIFLDKEEKPVKLLFPTNSEGLYRGFIPYRYYYIEIQHLSSGNVTYLYLNKTSYLEPDVTKLAQSSANTGGTGSSGSRQTYEVPKITKNIHLYEGASRIWGYVYWDHNGDDKFYMFNQSTGDNVVDPNLPFDSGTRNSIGGNTRANTTDGTEGTDSTTERSAEFSYFELDTTGPQRELLIGARLAFKHESGNFYTSTDINGRYSLFLPPGNTTVELDDPRFEPLVLTNQKSKLSIFMPFNKSDQKGTPRNFSVKPLNTTISGYTWYDREGIDNLNFDSEGIVTNVPIKFTLLNPAIIGENNKTFTRTVISDIDTGKYTVTLIPGEYSVEIDYKIEDVVKYTHSQLLSVPFYNPDPQFTKNFGVIKYVYSNLSITTDDFELDVQDLENITLKLYYETGGQLKDIPLKLNGTYFLGYINPGRYTIWLEYSTLPGKSVTEGTRYVYFGSINISENEHNFQIVLNKATEVTITGFVDIDNSGNLTNSEEKAQNFNITLLEPTGGIFKLQVENGSLKQLLMSGKEYKILVNDTRTQEATHGFRYVRYITEHSFETPVDQFQYFLDLPLIKYINFSGKVYYDENENGKGDNNEIYPDVPIHFIGPMNYTVYSDVNGRFSKFVLPGEYFVTIDFPGFLERPKVYSYNVTLDDTFFDLDIVPIKVRVYGLTFFDANKDNVYNPNSDTLLKDQILRGVTLSFARNILIEPDPSQGAELPYNEPLEEFAIKGKSNSATGEYEIYVPPGEYNLNAYVETSAGTIYCALELRIIGRVDKYQYNISLYNGRLVEGNVFYRDSELREIYDLDSQETGNGLKFENLETGGSKIVLYRGQGTIDSMYLPYGNYTVTTEFLTDEQGISVDYSLSDTVWIRPEISWYTFELNKENDYNIELKIVGEQVVELRTADIHEKVYKVTVTNKGNTYNVVDLFAENVPKGWYVHLSNSTIPLDIVGKYSKVNITIDITIPVFAFAENTITLKGEPRGNPASAKSVTLNVNTPASYDFEVKYEDDVDRGIGFNDTITLKMDVTKKGNAADDIYFKFYNYQRTWNVSIKEAWDNDNAAGGVDYKQDIDSFAVIMNQEETKKSVTLQIRSPEQRNASFGEVAVILVRTFSNNKPEIEFTKQIQIKIRNPDIVLKDVNFRNDNLKDGTNVTIQATASLKDKYLPAVNFSLYVNDIWVENKTVYNVLEDEDTVAEFYWQVERYNLTNERGRKFKIKVVVNNDESVVETNYENNKIIVNKLIGELEPEEEFNWRPVYAVLTAVIMIFVVYGIYRLRKKI